MSGIVRWVAQLECGHTLGGECAEDHLPAAPEPLPCATCTWDHEELMVRNLVDIVDSRPLRVASPDA